MKQLPALALLIAFTLGVAGCGSINDISKGEDGQRIYGGIRQDASMIQSSSALVPTALGILDFPFSLVLDTAFLPVTVIFALFRSGR